MIYSTQYSHFRTNCVSLNFAEKNYGTTNQSNENPKDLIEIVTNNTKNTQPRQ